MSSDKKHPSGEKAPTLVGEKPEAGIEEILEKHGKKIAALLIAVVAALGITFFVRAKKESNRREAGEALTAAVTRDDLGRVAELYSGTLAGGNALLLLAERQIAAKQEDKAKETLE